jgi:voltage-gated potassium channel
MKARFTVLLGLLVALILLHPPLAATPAGRPVLLALYWGILVVGALTAVQGRLRLVAIALGAPALLSDVVALSSPDFERYGAQLLFHALFMAFVAVRIQAFVMVQRIVTLDLIRGALCVYLLAGIFFAQIHALIEYLMPGSYVLLGEPLVPGEGARGQLVEFVYYSFVTMTTLGYGDMSPIAPVARALAALQAVFGQIYPALLIAELVGARVVQRQGAG